MSNAIDAYKRRSWLVAQEQQSGNRHGERFCEL